MFFASDIWWIFTLMAKLVCRYITTTTWLANVSNIRIYLRRWDTFPLYYIPSILDMICGAKPKITPNSNVDYPKVNRWHLHKTLEKGGQIPVQQFNLSLYCDHVNKEKMTSQWKNIDFVGIFIGSTVIKFFCLTNYSSPQLSVWNKHNKAKSTKMVAYIKIRVQFSQEHVL